MPGKSAQVSHELEERRLSKPTLTSFEHFRTLTAQTEESGCQRTSEESEDLLTGLVIQKKL